MELDIPPGLVFVRDLASHGIDDRGLRRAAERGTAVRLRRGVYFNGPWKTLTAEERYRLRCEAVARATREPPVLSHQSAAAILGLPSLDSWVNDVHITIEPAAGGRSRNGVRRHVGVVPAASRIEVDGMLVTNVPRTVIDLATTASFRSAVAAADFALRARAPLTSRDELWAEFTAMRPFNNMRRAQRVLEFATELSDSPGESLSRVVMHELGFPEPELQAHFTNRDGGDIYTDFYWPEHSVVGEFDGRAKYEREQYLGGFTPEEKLWKEKRREDDVRRHVRRFVRWGWKEAMNPVELRELLDDAGLPRLRIRLLP